MVLSQSSAQLLMNKLYFNVRTGCVEFREKRLMNIFDTDKVKRIGPVSDAWKDKPKSNTIKFIMKMYGLTAKDAADIFGVSVTYFNNKLFRGSFSFDDIVLLSEACGCSLCFIPKNGNFIFKPSIKKETEDRLQELRTKKLESKKKEREELKARLKALEKELEEGDL